MSDSGAIRDRSKSLVAEKKKQQNEKEFLADTSNSKALSDWT